MQRMKVLDRMPCASILVRINLAPMTDDNTRPLGIEDYP